MLYHTFIFLETDICDSSPCTQHCTVEDDAYICSCSQNYVLQLDGFSCKMITTTHNAENKLDGIPKIGGSTQEGGEASMSTLMTGLLVGVGLIILILIVGLALFATRYMRMRKQVPSPEDSEFETPAFENEIYGTVPMASSDCSVAEEHNRTAAEDYLLC